VAASSKPRWEPPADPDLEKLAREGWAAWERDRPTVIAFDTETSGLAFHDRAFGVSLAWKGDHLLTPDGVAGFWFETERFDSREALRRIFAHATHLVAHNWKFDAHKVTALGVVDDWSRFEIHDTEGMAHLDDEHRPKGLKDLAVSLLGWDDTILIPGTQKCPNDCGKDPDCEECAGKGRVEIERPVPRSEWEIKQAREWAKKKYGLASVKDVGYDILPRGTVVPYAILDAEWTYRLAQLLHPRILRYPDTLIPLYEQEMLLSRGAMYGLEQAGIGTRVEYTAAKVKEYRKRCLEHEAAIEAIVGKPVRTGKIPPKERADYFNPSSSSPDVGNWLAERGFPRDSYDADNLKGIDHPLAQRLLSYRKDVKLLDGYFVALQKEVGADGVFHPSIRQHGTVSGRTSAGAEKGDQ
jgi:DNA polymerase I-like protein with 3'-5' exonuclease and polymerase domains